MITDRNHIRKMYGLASLLAYAFFGILIILALYFFKERIIYIDTANQLFEMINTGKPTVFVGRYAMIFSQILPLIAIKLGMSLRAVVLIFSLSFVLVYLICFWICTEKLKNLAAGLCISITFIAASHTFFHAISETVQLISFSCLLFAWLQKLKSERSINKWRLWEWMLTWALCLLNFFIHPVALFTVLFILLYVFYSEIQDHKWTLLFTVAAWIGLFALKAFVFSKGSHDESFFAELKHTPQILQNFWNIHPVAFIRHHFFQFYLLPILMWLILQIHWVNDGKFKWMVLYNLFLAGFMLITLIIYNKGDAQHGMERSFLPLILFIGLPFMQEVFLPILENHRITGFVSLGFLGICLLLSLSNIGFAAKVFSKRTQILEEWIYNSSWKKSDKFILNPQDLPNDKLQVHYGTAVETLLLSSLDNPQASKTFYINKGELDTLSIPIDKDHFLFTPYWPIRFVSELNPNYFKLNGLYNPFNPYVGSVDIYSFDLQKTTNGGLNAVDVNGYVAKVGGRLLSDSLGRNVAILLSPEQPYGFEFRPVVSVGASIEASIEMRHEEKTAFVLTDGKIFLEDYASETMPDGWIRATKRVSLPPSFNVNELKIYVWYNGQESLTIRNLNVVVHNK